MQTRYSPMTSAGPPWRRAKLVAASLGVALASFGTLTAVTALPASAASVTSSNFTIGSPTGGVNAVSATPTSTVQSTASVSYAVSFTATAALAMGFHHCDAVRGVGSVPANGALVDQSSAACSPGSTVATQRRRA